MENILETIKRRRELLERSRIATQEAHDRSSDYCTPPSIAAAKLEGQVQILDWVIEKLEANEQ